MLCSELATHETHEKATREGNAKAPPREVFATLVTSPQTVPILRVTPSAPRTPDRKYRRAFSNRKLLKGRLIPTTQPPRAPNNVLEQILTGFYAFLAPLTGALPLLPTSVVNSLHSTETQNPHGVPF